MSSNQRDLRLAWSLPFFTASLAVSSLAIAQEDISTEDETQVLEEVLVTGSRISRSQFDGPSPVVTLDSEDFQAEGFTTVYEAINSLTQTYGNTQDDQFAGGFTQNANTVDLRGLGPGRTLVLINGRRTTDYPLPFNGQSNLVNLASIPVAAVDRVEILAGGASAIYGSDAVAGVINIVMRQEVEGVDVRLRLGDTTEGGGESQRLQVVGGLNGDNFHFTYALEYFNRDPIWGYQRDFMDSILDDPDGEPFVNTRSLLALDAFDAFRVGSVGLRYIDPTPAACDNWAELDHSFRPGAGYFCGRDDDISQFTIRNGTENYSAFLNGSYEISSKTELFGYLSYINKDSEFNVGTLFWQSNRFGPNADGSNTFSNLGNIVQYDLSPFGIGVIEWPQVTLLQRIFTASEMGGQDVNNNHFDEESFDVAFGIRGDFATDWEYELTVSHSKYELTRERRLILADEADAFFAGDLLTNLEPDPLFGGFFADLGDLTDPNAVYNRPLTPAEFLSISDIDRTEADSSNSTVSASVVGELWELPAGPIGFAGIAEWGTQEYDINLDPRLRNGVFWGFTGTGGGGERDRYAIGAEFLIPVTDQLTATAAVRYDRYDDITDVDGAPTYALGLEYRPIEPLLLRGRFATSFRAPDMHYVFADPSGFFQTVPDYYLCARDLGIDESSPGGLASCIDPVRGSLGGTSVQGTRAGNPGLEEEEGESYTIGFVWEILDNLTVSVDYYDIHLENIVADRSVDTLLRDERACLLGGSYTVTAGTNCDDVLNRIIRNPADGGINSETLSTVAIGPFNQAVQETNGVDAAVNWSILTNDWGMFSLDATWTRVLDQKAATLPSDPVVSFADGGTQDFRSRFRATFGWTYRDFNATLFMNRLGSSLTNDSLFSDTKNRVDAQTYWNASFRYMFNDNFSMTLIGNNIFNKKPPITSEEEYPYFNIFNYDPYGRELFVELSYLFL